MRFSGWISTVALWLTQDRLCWHQGSHRIWVVFDKRVSIAGTDYMTSVKSWLVLLDRPGSECGRECPQPAGEDARSYRTRHEQKASATNAQSREADE